MPAPASAPAARSFSIASVLFPPEEICFSFPSLENCHWCKKKKRSTKSSKIPMHESITLKISVVFDIWQNPRLQDLEKYVQSLAVQNTNSKPLTCWGSADHQRVSKIQCFSIIQSSKGKPENDGFQTYSYLLFQALILR